MPKNQNSWNFVILIVFMCANIGFGITNVFFFEYLPNFGETDLFSLNAGFYLGIISLVVGSIIFFVVIKHPVSRIWKSTKEYSRKREFKVKFKKTEPQNAEESMELLNKYQTKIDNLSKNKQYARMIPYIQEKIRLYDKTSEFLTEIGMFTLVKSLENEKRKIEDLLYDVEHNLWVFKYNDLSSKIKSYQKKNEFHEVANFISKMITLIKIRIDSAKKWKKSSDILKYKSVHREYKMLHNSNEAIIVYRKNESLFNWIVKEIKKNNLSDSLSQINTLQEDLDGTQSLFRANVSKNPSLSNILAAVDNLVIKVRNFKKKIETQFTAILQNLKSPEKIVDSVTADFDLPELSKISLISLKTPLYAKVVLLGESSVGKTHLVLTMTEGEYSATQGSTVGVDQYFKSVNLPTEGYDPQICFWDLGGQWNFRNINELFLNEASAILLVYDVTRPETFAALKYWLGMIKKTRCPALERLFIIGNKIDVGGNTIPEDEIKEFSLKNNLSRFYMSSAKTGEGVNVIAEDIAGCIDWSSIIYNIDKKHVSLISDVIKNIRNKTKIQKTADLLNELSVKSSISDLPLIKAILRQCVSQNIIQFGKSDIFCILDPEFIDKKIAKIIQIAAASNGMVTKTRILKNWPLPEDQLDLLLMHLETENICYLLSKGTWVFPNVLHIKEIKIDERTRLILDSAPLTLSYKIIGPGDLILDRLIVAIAREIQPPKFVSNMAAYWLIGKGKNQTALFMQLIPSFEGGVIRFRAGGGQGKSRLEEFIEIAKHIFDVYASHVEKNPPN